MTQPYNMPLPIATGDFQKIKEQGYDHVDKSLFIKAVMDDPAESMLITRPRRFGKTYNMHMLRCFFDRRHAQAFAPFFKDTKIETAKSRRGESCMAFQGKYPTIFITLKDIRPETYDQFLRQMADKVSELYESHFFLLEDQKLLPHQAKYFQNILHSTASPEMLAQSLRKLTAYLQRATGEKVILLLDEYDTPFHAAYGGQEPFLDRLAGFMKIFYGAALKDNAHLQKAIITGILRLAMMDLFSGANSIAVRSMTTKKYEQYFGFTEDETAFLVKRHNPGLSEAELAERLDQIRSWYNGYSIGDVLLYNPWSIVQCLDHEGRLDTYWNASGEDSLLGQSLLNADFDVKAQLVALARGDSIDVPLNEASLFADLKKDAGALWSLMVSSGYLKVLGEVADPAVSMYTVAIPNKELGLAYRNMVQNWFKSIGASAYLQLFRSLSGGHLDAFERSLQNYLESSVSSRDLGPETLEKYYHVMLLGMFFALKGLCTVDSNKAYGQGFYDIVLIPLDPTIPAYVFEFKKSDSVNALEKKAKMALKQIDQRKYDARLKQANATTIIHVGIAFHGKQMHMMHRKMQ